MDNKIKASVSDIDRILSTLTDKEKEFTLGDQTFEKPVIFKHIIFDNDKPIGFIRLLTKRVFDGDVFVQFAIDPKYRGKGYAKELINAAKKYIKTNKDIKNLYYNADIDNIVSQKFAEKSGYKLLNSDDKKKTYLIESAADDIDILNKIIKFNERTNKFKYGLVFPGDKKIDHEKHNVTTLEDYKKYWRSATPEEFVEHDGGICWEYVSYIANWLKNNYPMIKYETFYIQFDNKQDYPTHSFLIFELDGKYYLIESSMKRARYLGVFESDIKYDLIDKVMYAMSHYNKNNENKDNGLLQYKYNIYKYDCLDKRMFGLDYSKYIEFIYNHSTKINHKYSDTFNVQKVDINNIPNYKFTESAADDDTYTALYMAKELGNISEASMNNIIDIDFPEEEINILKKQNKIITTRVSAEYNKYNVGDLVRTPWGDIFKVLNIKKFRDIENHPYLDELTEDQINLLSKYKKMDLVTMYKQKDVKEFNVSEAKYYTWILNPEFNITIPKNTYRRIIALLERTPKDRIFISTDWHIYKEKYSSGIGLYNECLRWCKENLNYDDVFIYLGDVGYKKLTYKEQAEIQQLMKSIKCYKILIVGNHDLMMGDDTFIYKCGFDYVMEELEWNNLIFTHIPIKPPAGYLNIHGHIHDEEGYTNDEGKYNLNAYPSFYDNKPVSLEYLLNNKDKLVKTHFKNHIDNTGPSQTTEEIQAELRSIKREQADISENSLNDFIDYLKTKDKKIFELKNWIYKNIKYDKNDSTWKLKSPEEVFKTKLGNCHDQAHFIKYCLSKLGYNPVLYFMMSYNKNTNQGGKTHTLCTWSTQDNKGYINYLDNESGILGDYEWEPEPSINNLKNKCLNTRMLTNKIYPDYIWTKISSSINYGVNLQEYVDRCCSNISSVNEACKDVAIARQFVTDVDKLAKKYDANYFIVTDGASGVRNNGNPAVRNARLAQIEWEKNNNGDPDEDWSDKVKNGKYNEGWRADLPDSSFGIPEDRKFPLDTEGRVKSAIHLFGHAPEGKKKSLARRISRAANRYGIKIPETTQVYKYLHESNNTNESGIAAMASVNPIVGGGGNYILRVQEPEDLFSKLVYSRDPSSGKGLIVNENNKLEIIDVDESYIIDKFKFIGNEAYIDKLINLYNANESVESLYNILTNKHQYTENQIDFDSNFKLINEDLDTERHNTELATFIEESNIISGKIPYSINSLLEMPIELNELHIEFPDIIMKEDSNGYYLYDNLSHKRTRSVSEVNLINKNMFNSLLTE